MPSPPGPKTEKGSAAGPENGIAKHRLLVNVTALVIGIALNLLKGIAKLCFFIMVVFCSVALIFFWGGGTFQGPTNKRP